MPLGLLWVLEFAKVTPDTAEFERRIDRLLMYLAKYAHQDAIRMLDVPTAWLQSWARRIEEIMDEERHQLEGAR